MIRPPNPSGVLFVNTGGSDPVVVVAWEAALRRTEMFSGLSNHYDMMFMDIRGTYGSNMISLSLDAVAALPPTYPQNESEYSQYKKGSAAFFQSWIDNSSPPGILQFVSTKEVVQDYEQIRKALGYRKIHFLGESYGTYWGYQYGLAFPDRVGNFALDSGVPHGMRDETGIGMTVTWELQLACSGWPFPEAPETSDPNPHKMLFVTADYDADSPTEWTTYIWEKQARRSAMLVRHGDGHVSFQLPNHPSSLITKEFLRSGRLPEARNGTIVSVYSPGTRRDPIPDPYLVQTGTMGGEIESNN
ncbi:unnamed protein product [Clonostachys rosea f. rosea IK726]|uniref:Uncharacterized protein n=1 Tax=Clonostachys rosea f. rosea IK726 TaxID=1349383 RepID=A0ACA9U9I2_BIOOC|nr:unnamed protein product [Clonostachys rosea f. rosea IK726]